MLNPVATQPLECLHMGSQVKEDGTDQETALCSQTFSFSYPCFYIMKTNRMTQKLVKERVGSTKLCLML